MNEDQWKVDQTAENEPPAEGAAISNEVTDLYTSPDIYETSSNPDIYTAPVTEMTGVRGVFSGQGNISQNQPYGPQGNISQNQPYGSQGNISQNQPYGSQGNIYQNQAYDSGAGYYRNQSYNPQGNPYQNQPYGSQGNAYQGQMYGSQGNVNQNQPYGLPGNSWQNPYYGPQNGYNNPYSPYAVPVQHKKHTGLIIGVVIGIIILFLIAIFAVLYYALRQIAQNTRGDNSYHNSRNYDYFGDDDYNWDYDYDDYYDYDGQGETGSEYYELEDAIRYDLSYSVSWEYYEYEPEADEDVAIMVTYPVIEGASIPNLDRINDLFHEEVEVITGYYKDDYSDYMTQDGYFGAYSSGYVTYMDEDVLSVVFAEEIYSDYYGYVNLYSINVDMRNGVVIKNTDLLDIDDSFSIDFRQRSEEQNGSVSGLDYMSDQEITNYLTDSDSLIVFYTPLGMEIGLNYSDGWVTVTYKDYENYLKIF